MESELPGVVFKASEASPSLLIPGGWVPALAAGGHLTFASGRPSRPLPRCLGLSLLTSGLCSVPAALCPDGRGLRGSSKCYEDSVNTGLGWHTAWHGTTVVTVC